ncbi:MAG: hypothetical protein WKF91_20580 [Segetibacter sp.]
MSTAQPKPSGYDTLIISYLTLRKWVGFLGILLVPILIFGSFIFDANVIQVSISAYYHTSMRDVFVGILSAISMFLFSYNGYERQDAIASKSAGLFALCIAFLPTSPVNDKTDITSILHYITAAIFFAILSYMSIFLFTKTRGDMTREKKKRNKIYRACGVIMAVSVIGIPIVKIPAISDYIALLEPVLVLETLALFSFGFSWLIKGEFLLKDDKLENVELKKDLLF